MGPKIISRLKTSPSSTQFVIISVLCLVIFSCFPSQVSIKTSYWMHFPAFNRSVPFDSSLLYYYYYCWIDFVVQSDVTTRPAVVQGRRWGSAFLCNNNNIRLWWNSYGGGCRWALECCCIKLGLVFDNVVVWLIIRLHFTCSMNSLFRAPDY